MKATLIDRGSGSTSVPVRAGFPIPRGRIWPGRAVLTIDGVPLPEAQLDQTATWEDGSVAHVLFSWRQSLISGQRVDLDIIDGARDPAVDPWHPLVKKLLPLFDLELALVDAGGSEWSLRAGVGEGAQALHAMMQAGSSQSESRALEVLAPLRSLAGDHPQVRARIRIRIPTDTAGFSWQIVVENCNAVAQLVDVAFSEIRLRWGADHRTVPAGLLQAGERVLFEGWTGSNQPAYDVVLDGALLEELMIAPPIDWNGGCDEAAGIALFGQLAKQKNSDGSPSRGPAPPNHIADPVPTSSFPIYMNGGDTGDRADIGVLPLWSIAYLNGGSIAACNLQRWADTHGSCAFPIHWRDPLVDEIGVRHGHVVWKASATPDVGIKSGEKADVAHHALVGALTYLATGNQVALEELRSWALLAARLAYPNDGTLQNPGDRREAWALRTIAIAARFLPDWDATKPYLQSTLTRTAAEWEAALPRIKVECPLGNMHPGTWHPGGRDSSPCSFIGSMWQQAWFLFEALAADELMGAPLFRPLVDHGWKWWLGFLDTGTTWDSPAGGGQARFSVDLLVDYSTPVGVYQPRLVLDPKTGRQVWDETPGSLRPIDHLGELAYQARIYIDHGQPALGPADMPPDPRPEFWTPISGTWTPVKSSAWFEYGFGRPGLHVVARRYGMQQAAEVAAVAFPLVDADHTQGKRANWARVRA